MLSLQLPEQLFQEEDLRFELKLQINHFLLPLVLELSWPADVPDEQREKRYFRFEIFNEQFEQKVS